MSSGTPENVRLDPALAALTAGSRVGGGRFTLLRPLGQGGMGVVWLARDEQLREDVALKFLPAEIRHDAVALDDLRRETSRSRKLTHANIVRIHDLYRTEQEAFISMEYVDGANLSELRLQQPDRVFTWSFLEPLLKQLCEALDYAHGEGIVHRDLKPANLMLDRRGRLKLADFGVAATVSDSVSRVSMGRHMLSGTASYMSPQQLNGQSPEAADDIYSLGSTLYELLASRAPFFTGDIAHQVRALAPQPLDRRLAQLRIDNPVPPGVNAAVMACLSKAPEKRPQSGRAVLEQIHAPNSHELPNARTAPPKPAAQAQPAATLEHRPRAWRKGPLAGIAAVIALIVIAGGAAWWLKQRPSADAAAAPVAPAKEEFVPLFNGRDFSGWDGDPQLWSIKDGAITATNGTSQERRPIALFWRGGAVDDFELRLSFRIKSGNSGIYYRAKRLAGYEVGGYQFEISGDISGLLIESGIDRARRTPSKRGSITTANMINGKETVTTAGPTDASPLELRDAYRRGDWNDVVIIARGNHIIQKLNGHALIETTDHYEQRPTSGLIALEVYGNERTFVQFRDIRLKRLTR